MVGKAEITKKFILELTEAEVNTVMIGVGMLAPQGLQAKAGNGLVVVSTDGFESELILFYRAIKNLAETK